MNPGETSDRLPWSEDAETFATRCLNALRRGKVRRAVVCGRCGKKWETEYDRACRTVQKKTWICDCSHSVVDYFTR